MEIRLPKDKSALRIKHLPAFQDKRLADGAASISLKIDTIHKFTGLSKPQLWRVDANDLTKMFNHLILTFASIDNQSSPPKYLKVGDKEFELVDIEKAPSGWHADNEESDYVLDPVRLACICYIPKGSFYGEIDQHDNLKYPIRSRHELFSEEFPLEVYMQLTAFFLRKFNRSMKGFTDRLIKSLRRQKRKESSFGRAFSILWPRNTTSAGIRYNK